MYILDLVIRKVVDFEIKSYQGRVAEIINWYMIGVAILLLILFVKKVCAWILSRLEKKGKSSKVIDTILRFLAKVSLDKKWCTFVLCSVVVIHCSLSFVVGLTYCKYTESYIKFPANSRWYDVDVGGMTIEDAYNKIVRYRSISRIAGNSKDLEYGLFGEFTPDYHELCTAQVLDSVRDGEYQKIMKIGYKLTDEEGLAKVVNSKVLREAQDAEIRFSKDNGPELVNEVCGYRLKADENFFRKLKVQSTSEFTPIDSIDMEIYREEPKVTSAQLETRYKKLKAGYDKKKSLSDMQIRAVLPESLKYQKYYKKEKSNRDITETKDYRNWEKAYECSVYRVPAKAVIYNQSKGSVSLDSELLHTSVVSFVNKLAEKTDTVNLTREFKTISEKWMKVKPGNLGRELDKAGMIEEIENIISKKYKKSKVAKNVRVKAKWTGSSQTRYDVGDTYIEVSIKKQKMWFFQDGKCKLSTKVVTGKMTEERRTKTGAFRILYKQKDRILRGARKSYATHVDYWMPFTEDGQGLHDADWRAVFGKEIYKNSGSHGCVNMPDSKAKRLYDMVETGTPVIVY